MKSVQNAFKVFLSVLLLFFLLICTYSVTSLTISGVQYVVSPNNDVAVTYKLILSPDEKRLFEMYSSEFMQNMTEQGMVQLKSKNMLSFTLPGYAKNFSVDNKTSYFFPGFYYKNLTEISSFPQDLELLKSLSNENPAPKLATITWPDGKMTNFLNLDYVPNIYHVMASGKKTGK